MVTESRFNNKARWLTEMERLGPRAVRARLRDGRPVTDQLPYPDVRIVEGWLNKKDRDASRRRAHYCASLVLISIVIIVAASWFGL